MDLDRWAIIGTIVLISMFFISLVCVFSKNLENKTRLTYFEIFYALTILLGAFISTFSAMIDSKKSKLSYVGLNAFYSILTAIGVAIDITMEMLMQKRREYYQGNRFVYDVEADEAALPGDHWYVRDHDTMRRMTFRNWVRILLCAAGVGLALFESIWRATWASLEIGCLSLLPVTLALDVVATRAHKLYVGTIKVSCLVQYVGPGAPQGDDSVIIDVEKPEDLNDWAQQAVPLYSGCIRSVSSKLPGVIELLSNTPGVPRLRNRAVRSTFTSYTVDFMIKNRSTPFTFIERTSKYDPHDWAIISKVDVIVVSFSLVDGNFSANAIKDEISRLRRLAPGVPMFLVGDLDRHRAEQMTELEVINQRVANNASQARGLVQSEGLECYMGINHRSSRFADLLVSTLAVFCSLY